MNCLQWYFVTFVAISCSSSLSLESADTANPLALTVIEESDVKTDASIALEVIEGSDDDPIEDEAINTILKACYNNGYYYPNTYYYPNNNYYRPTTNNNQLQNALAIGGLGLGAGVLSSLLIGAITPGNTVVGRSAIKDILTNLPAQEMSQRALDTSQLPIPTFLQNIVQQVQSGNSIDSSNFPPFITTFINQLQTGTLPPMLQNLVTLIQASSSQSATTRADQNADVDQTEQILKACYSSGYRYPSYSRPTSSSYSRPTSSSYSNTYRPISYTSGSTYPNTGSGSGYNQIAFQPIPIAVTGGGGTVNGAGYPAGGTVAGTVYPTGGAVAGAAYPTVGAVSVSYPSNGISTGGLYPYNYYGYNG